MFVKYMAEAGDGRGKEEHLSNGFSRDVFDKFEERRMKTHADEEDEKNGIELSLGLSLHGRFGLDPKKSNSNLMRSSSVSPFMLGGGEEDSHAPKMPNIAAYSPLSRTYSLPTETEEQWRKRKELQPLRGMEAKKRRRMMDKVMFARVGKDQFDLENNSGGEEKGYNPPINSNGQDFDCINGNGDIIPSSQGSSSSGLFEFDSPQPLQANKTNEVIKESIVHKAADKGTKEAKKMPKNAMLDMPYVSTVGNGPNGKRIEGFLYRYRKREEVKILCVCHGSFLSPAEFVKHAGGTEVEHPLRHIVVNPSPFL